jgi:hypothetical protein
MHVITELVDPLTRVGRCDVVTYIARRYPGVHDSFGDNGRGPGVQSDGRTDDDGLGGPAAAAAE